MATVSPAAPPLVHAVAVRRACLPEVLTSGTGDLPGVLGVRTESAALRFVRREGIPHSKVGRRVYVRRAALLAWLEEREAAQAPPRPIIPAPAPWALELLGRGKRRRPEAPGRRRGAVP